MALILSSLLLETKLADAKIILHYDLASYYDMSDRVVWVEEDEVPYEKDGDGYLERVKVLKVYKGDIQQKTMAVFVASTFARHRGLSDAVWKCSEEEKSGCRKWQLEKWTQMGLGKALMFLAWNNKMARYELINMRLMSF